MPRERRQNGWVDKAGKRQKKWVGHWFEYVTKDGVEKRQPRSKVLGPVTGMTKGAAQDKLRDLIRGERPPETNATFEQLSAWYLKTKSGDWARTTRGVMASVFKHQINPAIGHMRIAGIKATDVKQALNTIAADATASESLLKKCRTHIRAVFEMALEDGHIGKNPAVRLELPKFKKASERFLAMDECKRLLEVASGRDRLIVYLFLAVGLRPSELFALRVDDVRAGELRIDEAVVRGTVGETKTEDSDAMVPLPPMLEAELRQYIHENKLAGPAHLFATASTKPVSQNNYLARVLKPLGVLAGIDVYVGKTGKTSSHLTHQALRRTTGTHFQRHGQIKDTQSLMRHGDAMTTLKHYQKTLEASLISGVASWEKDLLN